MVRPRVASAALPTALCRTVRRRICRLCSPREPRARRYPTLPAFAPTEGNRHRTRQGQCTAMMLETQGLPLATKRHCGGHSQWKAADKYRANLFERARTAPDRKSSAAADLLLSSGALHGLLDIPRARTSLRWGRHHITEQDGSNHNHGRCDCCFFQFFSHAPISIFKNAHPNRVLSMSLNQSLAIGWNPEARKGRTSQSNGISAATSSWRRSARHNRSRLFCLSKSRNPRAHEASTASPNAR
jgi:hypothetical protein